MVFYIYLPPSHIDSKVGEGSIDHRGNELTPSDEHVVNDDQPSSHVHWCQLGDVHGHGHGRNADPEPHDDPTNQKYPRSPGRSHHDSPNSEHSWTKYNMKSVNS